MKLIKMSALLLTMGILTACALTPAEKAAQAKERAQKLLDTQVSLAQQCSPQTANLMAQMPSANDMPAAQKKAFEANYTKAVNNPAFQACYNLAWKAYREQNAIQAQQMAAWDEASDMAWDNGFFFDGPFGWDGGWGPY